jgi:hypothetical protein
MNIPTDCWIPNPERTGYLNYDKQRPAVEVLEEVRQHLGSLRAGADGATSLLDQMEYFDLALGLGPERTFARSAELPVFPRGRWVAVFAVRGASEGYYIHVDVVQVSTDSGLAFRMVPAFLGKTFDAEHAKKAVAALTFLLEAG